LLFAAVIIIITIINITVNTNSLLLRLFFLLARLLTLVVL